MDEAREERRQQPRRRTLKGGQVVFNNRHSTVDCTVRNISEGGALVVFPHQITVPDTFELNLQDGTVRACRQVWRAGAAIGVAFVSAERGLELRLDGETLLRLGPAGDIRQAPRGDARRSVVLALQRALAALEQAS
ncbi:PilZ domain-containing protein [Prosthecomicrobium sp. N25]|uniref:PilZ domain-containing protein n=1 Tax=Prosthecomicrobium sp. N25 TaxID=3129254 RepID=UPI003076D18B